jgi:hypothetical protein
MRDMGKFVCNLGAMCQEERLRYQALTKRLFTSVERREVADGYIFDFQGEVEVIEVAEWVSLERKCCPFFNFRIDVLSGEPPISLGITGETGIKEFIRSELDSPQRE